MAIAVCVMAKAPVPGRVNTRLCPPLSEQQAADLAAAFLSDVWRIAISLRGATAILSYSGERDAFPPEFADVESIPQRSGDLGARIEHTARMGLERADQVLIIGSDLPGLTVDHLRSACLVLREHDAVLGPSHDGGFYLIGLRKCPEGLLAELPWSVETTYRETHDRLLLHGLSVGETRRFGDVDTIDDLRALRNAIVAGSLLAPASAQALSQLSCI